MRVWKPTDQLLATVKQRIDLLDSEDKYMKNFLETTSTRQSVSSIEDDILKGTMIPTLFSSADTFIQNPQGVGIGIMSRMAETDPTVQSSLQLKSQMMLSKIGEYQHDDPEIQDFVRMFLERMEGPTWVESLEAQSSAVPFGFSVSEIGWGLVNWKGQLRKVPKRVPTYHPSTICFEVDRNGYLTPDGIIQFTIQNSQFANPNSVRRFFDGFDMNPFETPQDELLPYRMPYVANYGLARIPRGKVIHHTNNAMTSFGSPYGKAYVRVAHLAWQLKVFFMKQMGVAGKRNAQPFIWATAPMQNNKVEFTDPDTGQKSTMTPIMALNRMLQLREMDDSVTTGPMAAGYNLTAVPNTADLNQYLAVLQWLDTQIFRGFTLPSLIMSEASSGSRALGDKHFQLVDRMAEVDAQKFTSNIVRSMIRPAIDQNFGQQESYGHFAQRPQSIEERERLSNMFNALANGQWMDPHNAKDGEFVRSSLHLPDQDESFFARAMPNFGPIKGDGDAKPAGGGDAAAAPEDQNDVGEIDDGEGQGVPAGDEAGE